ncbi:MAG: tetratricopeptide repeat protein [Deferrisomatales bacterium]
MARVLGVVFGLAAVVAAGCAGPWDGLTRAADPPTREVTLRVARPPAVNLYDRGAETLGVAGFEGQAGAQLSDRLAAQLEETGAFRVVGPAALGERLMKTGLALAWQTPASTLRWIRERTGIDAAVVGRVEVFRVEDREVEKQIQILQPVPGEEEWVVMPDGKIAKRPKKEFRSAPLFCRSDHGTVAASYRVYDLRRGDTVATVERELSTEVSSFCYRGDVPDRLKRQAQVRLLEKLLQRLNQQFVDEVLPRAERAQVAFEVVLGGGDPALVQRNELGILYASRGEWDRAAEMWLDCLTDRPDLASAHYNLAVAYRATAKLSLARAHLVKALARVRRPLYERALDEVEHLLAGQGS